MEIFESLLSTLSKETSAQQLIALRTASGQILVLENRRIASGDHTDEDPFLQNLALQGDTQITHLVCMWQEGCLDLPSMHLRAGLLEINPKNADTGLLLQGESRYLIRPLHTTLPKRKI